MSCAFFKQLPPNPTTAQIRNALIDSILRAKQASMLSFRRRVAESLLRNDDKLVRNIEKVYTYHSRDLRFLIDDLFADDKELLQKVDYISEHPEIIHLTPEELKNGFYPMGYVYALYWFAVTDTEADANTCEMLNRWHYEAIDAMWDELTTELGCERPALKYPTTLTA